MPLTEAQDRWLRSVFDVDVTNADAGARAGQPRDLGMVRQKLDKVYEGEHDKVAWRGRTPEDREKKHFVTRKLTDDERKGATLKADDHGRMRHRFGDLAEGTQLYAVSPETGEMLVGTDTNVQVRLGEGENASTTLAAPREGLAEVQRRIAQGEEARVEVMHHSSFLGGEDVAGAGMVEFERGKVVKVSNASGHYKPQFVHLLQTVELLLKSGAMLDTKLVDSNGNPIEHDSAIAKVYNRSQELIRQLKEDKKRIQAVINLPEDVVLDDVEKADFEAEHQRYQAKVELVERALAALRKMGVGPRNRMQGEVEYIGIKKDMDGAGVRRGDGAVTVPVSGFIRGRGLPDSPRPKHNPVQAEPAGEPAYSAEADAISGGSEEDGVYVEPILAEDPGEDVKRDGGTSADEATRTIGPSDQKEPGYSDDAGEGEGNESGEGESGEGESEDEAGSGSTEQEHGLSDPDEPDGLRADAKQDGGDVAGQSQEEGAPEEDAGNGQYVTLNGGDEGGGDEAKAESSGEGGGDPGQDQGPASDNRLTGDVWKDVPFSVRAAAYDPPPLFPDPIGEKAGADAATEPSLDHYRLFAFPDSMSEGEADQEPAYIDVSSSEDSSSEESSSEESESAENPAVVGRPLMEDEYVSYEDYSEDDESSIEEKQPSAPRPRQKTARAQVHEELRKRFEEQGGEEKLREQNAIVEGRAPELDHDAWTREIDALKGELKKASHQPPIKPRAAPEAVGDDESDESDTSES